MIENDHFDDFVDVFQEYKQSPSKVQSQMDNISTPDDGEPATDRNLEIKMDSCLYTLRQLMNSLKSGI